MLERSAARPSARGVGGHVAPFTESKDRNDAFTWQDLVCTDGFVEVLRVRGPARRLTSRTGTLEVATGRDHLAELEEFADRLEGPRRRAPPPRRARRRDENPA